MPSGVSVEVEALMGVGFLEYSSRTSGYAGFLRNGGPPRSGIATLASEI